MGSTYDFRKRAEVEEKVKVPKWNDNKVIEMCLALSSPHKLLYVCRHGSHLHGTNTPESDLDFKGLFLPNEDSCLLNVQPDSFRYSSGNDDTKNSEDDVDIEIWSVQKWINLLAKGDSNALSMLFSILNNSMIVFLDESMTDMFSNYQHLYDPNKVDGFVGFSASQAVKYGLKGKRLETIENIIEYINILESSGNINVKEDKLNVLNLEEVVKLCDSKTSEGLSHVELVTQGNSRYLKVLSKMYQDTLSLDYFKDRMKSEYDKYGKRSRSAKDLGGEDWKSLAHSMRTLFEAYELLSNGFINYPLVGSQVLLHIKKGRVSLDEYKEAYDSMEQQIQELKLKKMHSKYDQSKTSKMLINLYKKGTDDA